MSHGGTCDCNRHRSGGLITGIQKHHLELTVKPRFDHKWDGGNWDVHWDLDADGMAHPRPATYAEQIACLFADDVWVREVE